MQDAGQPYLQQISLQLQYARFTVTLLCRYNTKLEFCKGKVQTSIAIRIKEITMHAINESTKLLIKDIKRHENNK